MVHRKTLFIGWTPRVTEISQNIVLEKVFKPRMNANFYLEVIILSYGHTIETAVAANNKDSGNK